MVNIRDGGIFLCLGNRENWKTRLLFMSRSVGILGT